MADVARGWKLKWELEADEAGLTETSTNLDKGGSSKGVKRFERIK